MDINGGFSYIYIYTYTPFFAWCFLRCFFEMTILGDESSKLECPGGGRGGVRLLA
jgi:hypothetical protein